MCSLMLEGMYNSMEVITTTFSLFASLAKYDILIFQAAARILERINQAENRTQQPDAMDC